jgi:hypothetical protein
MPAHTRELHVPYCANATCTRKATVEVFDSRNSSYGYYCNRHGDEKVSAMNRLRA